MRIAPRTTCYKNSRDTSYVALIQSQEDGGVSPKFGACRECEKAGSMVDLASIEVEDVIKEGHLERQVSGLLKKQWKLP